MMKYRARSCDPPSFRLSDMTLLCRSTDRKKWPMQLYQEREVERKAWELHGGPEGFEA